MLSLRLGGADAHVSLGHILSTVNMRLLTVGLDEQILGTH